MNILSIGNSFSQDAHNFLYALAQDNGVNLETVNLYIGGCSLEMHWDNIKNDNAAYDLECNGNCGERKISIIEALKLKKWDVITLQQVSNDSGLYETYEPYLSSILSLIKKEQPDAKIYFHQTWAYEIDSNHSAFENYNNNQNKMYQQIKETSKIAAKSIGATLIPAGELVQTLRETVPEFDYKNGGLSLCRDGFHMSLDYGRFAVAAIWLRTITGQEIKTSSFKNFDTELISKIVNIVNKSDFDSVNSEKYCAISTNFFKIKEKN